MATPVFLPGESPWTEKPGGLLSMGLQRVGHDWLNTCRVLKICRVLFPAYSIKHNLGTAVKITTPFFSFFNDTISVGEKKKSLQMLLFHNRSLTADCLELGVQENGRKKGLWFISTPFYMNPLLFLMPALEGFSWRCPPCCGFWLYFLQTER